MTTPSSFSSEFSLLSLAVPLKEDLGGNGRTLIPVMQVYKSRVAGKGEDNNAKTLVGVYEMGHGDFYGPVFCGPICNFKRIPLPLPQKGSNLNPKTLQSKLNYVYCTQQHHHYLSI